MAGSRHLQPVEHESLPHGSATTPPANAHSGGPPSFFTQLMPAPDKQTTANPPSAPKHDNTGAQSDPN
jgi:hypothetical protein